MKKVKITVLRKTLIEDLAKEYGVEGLTKCPMLQEGQVFYADYAKPEGLCDEAWKAIYQYDLHWHIAQANNYFTMEIGFANQVLPFAVAMTDYAQLSSNWKRLKKKLK